MDNDEAENLAVKGFNLFMEGKNLEAKNEFIEALRLAEPNYWGLTDIHSNYGIVLRKLGEISEATEQFELTLSSALIAHKSESIAVTLARHALAEHFVRIGKFKKSLDVIEPGLMTDCEQKWLLYYVAALACCKLGEQVKCKEYASQVMSLAPKGKFSNLENLLTEIESKEFDI